MEMVEHSQHEISIAIIAAFIIFLILLLCFYSCLGLTCFSSFVLAYLYCLYYLFLFYSLSVSRNDRSRKRNCVWLYML